MRNVPTLGPTPAPTLEKQVQREVCKALYPVPPYWGPQQQVIDHPGTSPGLGIATSTTTCPRQIIVGVCQICRNSPSDKSAQIKHRWPFSCPTNLNCKYRSGLGRDKQVSHAQVKHLNVKVCMIRHTCFALSVGVASSIGRQLHVVCSWIFSKLSTSGVHLADDDDVAPFTQKLCNKLSSGRSCPKEPCGRSEVEKGKKGPGRESFSVPYSKGKHLIAADALDAPRVR